MSLESRIREFLEKVKSSVQKDSKYFEYFEVSKKLIEFSKEMDHTLSETWTEGDEEEHQDAVRDAEMVVISLDVYAKLIICQSLKEHERYCQDQKMAQDIKEWKDDDLQKFVSSCVRRFEECASWLNVSLLRKLYNNRDFAHFEESFLKTLKLTPGREEQIQHLTIASFVVGTCFYHLIAVNQETQKRYIPADVVDDFYIQSAKIMHPKEAFVTLGKRKNQ